MSCVVSLQTESISRISLSVRELPPFGFFLAIKRTSHCYPDCFAFDGGLVVGGRIAKGIFNGV
jgi:hypothetical protein